jgi:hypothetical protein
MLGPIIGAVVGVLFALWSAETANINWVKVLLVALAVAIALFLLLSIILARLRRVVWGSVGKLRRWLGGLRFSTSRQRGKLTQLGYDRRSDEVAKERQLSPRPRWRVTHADGDDWIYVHNSGYGVDDVVVRADPELFVFADGAKEGFIPGRLGDNVAGGSHGKQISGQLTERGEREGVTFTFSWTDQLGDAQPLTGMDDMPDFATLPARIPKQVSQPAWQIGRPKQNPAPDVWLLWNGADGFVGTEVKIDAEPAYFTFTLKRELGDLAGMGGLRFAGRPTQTGKVLGVTFTISYKDANGDDQFDYLPVEFGTGWGF